MLGSASSPKSFSEFVARVLASLSVTAWIPSAVLFSGLLLLREVDEALSAVEETDLLSAIVAFLANLTWNDVAIFVGAVVALNVAIQAFLFSMIRLLEGYWGVSFPARLLARICIRYQLIRRQRLEALKMGLDRRARRHEARWDAAVEACGATAAGHAKPGLVTRRRAGASGFARCELWASHNASSPGMRGRCARSLDRWLPLATLATMSPAIQRGGRSELHHAKAEADRLLASYPAVDRMLPTRVGNCLRSGEDAATEVLRANGSSLPIEQVLPMVFGRLSVDLQDEHDLHRGQLDLYAQMHLVLLILTVVSNRLLADARSGWSMLWVLGVAGIWVSNLAMCRAAEGYGETLVAIASQVREVHSEAVYVPHLTVSPALTLDDRSLLRVS